MIDMDEFVTWLNAVSTPLRVPVSVGPEMPEFANADNAGTATEVPGGEGLKREGVFEQVNVLLVIRTRSEKRKLLRQTAQALDDALLAVANQMLWGTYVLYVDRPGTIDASFEDPERVSCIANYAIEMGK